MSMLLLVLLGCFISGEKLWEAEDPDGDEHGWTEDCDNSDASAWTGDDCLEESPDDSGCEEPSEWFVDSDGDGFGAGSPTSACEQPEGTSVVDGDCDDADSTVNPDATERCGGVDDDCDGSVDEEIAEEDLDAWYADGDGDGFGAGEEVRSCEQPEGWQSRGDDCDDGDAEVHPHATELCDTQVDEDCDALVDEDATTDADPWFYDGDQDGFGDPSFSLTACEQPAGYVENELDCDDSDESRFPGAPAVCDDCLVNDCDGDAATESRDCRLRQQDIDSVSHALAGYGQEGLAGYKLGSADVNGDGVSDAIIGSNEYSNGTLGRAWLVFGPITGDLSLDASSVIESPQDSSRVGRGRAAAGLGDLLNGDGFEEVAYADINDDTGAQDAGVAYIFAGSAGFSSLAPSSAAVSLYGSTSSGQLGHYVLMNAGADLSGDGASDLLVSELDTLHGMSGLSSGEASTTGAAFSVEATAAIRSAAVADVDGDGTDELVVGSPTASRGGEVYVLESGLSGTVDAEASATLLFEAGSNEPAGASVAALDMDGDGHVDLAVGSPDYNVSRGRVFILAGPLASSGDLESLSDGILGMSDPADGGEVLEDVGDIDGDGTRDLAVGSPGYASSKGGISVYLGVPTGSGDLEDADIFLVGEAQSDHAGLAIRGAGDVTGDCHDDVLIGAYNHNSGQAGAGMVYLFEGAGI
ncbi:MAG: FG-GAP repeat protein [Alphaproteobacteria bacterium]|nr:FG-GAP repeat protein [Alphaproteobacteria bacterium]